MAHAYHIRQSVCQTVFTVCPKLLKNARERATQKVTNCHKNDRHSNLYKRKGVIVLRQTRYFANNLNHGQTDVKGRALDSRMWVIS